jgi:hypothetical protein
MDHLNGDRKFEGASKRKDLMGHRNEPYWQKI